jgi:hypothetical protein
MALLVKEKGGNYTLTPPGNHVARCVWAIDFGTQHSARYDKDTKKLALFWELPNEKHTFKEEDGPQPFMVRREFTASLSKKSNLRAFLESWRGRAFTKEELEGFELSKLVGQPCMVNVIHEEGEDRTYANIASVSQLMKGYNAPPQITPPVFYEIEQGKNDTYLSLPEWIREKIAACNEWNAPVKAQPAGGALPTSDELGNPAPEDEGDSEVPF